jgi:hypothetical protein
MKRRMTTETTIGTVNSLVAYDTISERIAFCHSALFAPAISTWCDAIDNGRFTTWPQPMSAQVRKHLPKGSNPMIKSHLHQQRANLRSTKPSAAATANKQDILIKNDFAPTQLSTRTHCFCPSRINKKTKRADSMPHQHALWGTFWSCTNMMASLSCRAHQESNSSRNQTGVHSHHPTLEIKRSSSQISIPGQGSLQDPQGLYRR